MMTPEEVFFAKIDYDLLKTQKMSLIEIADDLENKKRNDTLEHVEGLLSLLDELQDIAEKSGYIGIKEIGLESKDVTHGDEVT